MEEGTRACSTTKEGEGKVKTRRRVRRKKKVLSAEERKLLKVQTAHRKLVQAIFKHSGFSRVASLSDKEFSYLGTTCDFDDVFVFENVVVLAEYTVSQESNVSGHLKKKKILYDKINQKPSDFVEFLIDKFPAFAEVLDADFEAHHYRVIIAYCSRNALKEITKAEVPSVIYFDYNVVRYFEVVTRTVRKSSRFELFEFLGLAPKDVGESVIQPSTSAGDVYEGSVLPEGHSHFGSGFKVVSFYIDPNALLQRSYVLRRYGWRTGSNIYQRMISRSKIETVRKYLLDKKRVFVNNIVVTLPEDTKLLSASGETINVASINRTQPARIQLSNHFNTIGIIDGQHRVFSYHEGGTHEEAIAKLRKQQNLLVTGLIFPKKMSDIERSKFEATLFLEINSNQTNARSDLKQDIGLMLRPFAADSIAKRVVNLINDSHGPLNNEFERYFYDKEKLKTTSVVSYGVRPAVNVSADDALFVLWKNPNKEDLRKETNDALLLEYVEFCASEINAIIAGAKANIPSARWTADRKTPNRFLTTTNVNGLIGCLRRLVEAKGLKSVHQYGALFKNLDKFDFTKYTSSQYNRLAQDLYDRFLK
jgi:DGQHR domain-containing protein